MKRTIYTSLLLFAFTLLSCTKEEVSNNGNEGDSQVENPEDNSELMTIQAEIMPTKRTSRVAIQDPVENETDSKVFWSEGDEFRAFTKAGKTPKFTLQGKGGNESGTFTGTLGKTDKIQYAVYPSGYLTTYQNIKKDSLPIKVPNSYSTSESSQTAVMLGLPVPTRSNQLQFQHAMGMLKMVFTDLPEAYTHIMVSSSSDAVIAGKMSLNANDCMLTTSTTGPNSITIQRNPNQMIFYCPIPPKADYKAIYIEKSKDGKTYEKVKYFVNVAYNDPNDPKKPVGQINIEKGYIYTIPCNTDIPSDLPGLDVDGTEWR